MTITEYPFGIAAKPPEPAKVVDAPAASFVRMAGRIPVARSLVAIMLVAVATPIAALLVRADYFVEGALMPSAVILSFALLAVPAYSAIRDPLSSLRAEHLLMLGLVYWLLLDLLQGSYPLDQVTHEGMQSAIVAVGLFAWGVWISTLFSPWHLPAVIRRTAQIRLSADMVFTALVLCFALGFTRYAAPCNFNPFLMVSALLEDRWGAPWSRGELGGWDAILDHMAYFGYVVPALTVMLALQSRRLLTWKTIVGAMFSVIILAFALQSGSRRIVGVICGAAILTWVLSHWEKLKLKTIALAGLSAVAVVFVLQWVLVYRTVGAREAISGAEGAQVQGLHVDDNILRLGQMIDLVPAAHDHVYSRYLIWVAVRPVPRVLWPGKPLDPGIDFASLVGERGVSLSTSVVGEAYMSFGWLGIFLFGFLYGRLATAFTLVLGYGDRPTRALLYSFGVLSIFTGLRSGVELVLMSYTLIALLIAFVPFRTRLTAPSVKFKNVP